MVRCSVRKFVRVTRVADVRTRVQWRRRRRLWVTAGDQPRRHCAAQWNLVTKF
jgi:hypothetical protein